MAFLGVPYTGTLEPPRTPFWKRESTPSEDVGFRASLAVTILAAQHRRSVIPRHNLKLREVV